VSVEMQDDIGALGSLSLYHVRWRSISSIFEDLVPAPDLRLQRRREAFHRGVGKLEWKRDWELEGAGGALPRL
jgi:hypothetical protein